MRYLLNRQFLELQNDAAYAPGDEVLELLSFQEAEAACPGLQYQRVLLRNLREPVNCCKAEMLPEGIVGALLIPDKSAPLLSTVSLLFYFEQRHLILIDDEQQLQQTRERILDDSFIKADTVCRFFFEFLESLLDGDMVFLQNYEKRLSVMEDSLSDILPRELKSSVGAGRRELLIFQSYYQQLMDMFEIFSENINGFFPDTYSAQFQRLLARVDRLYDSTQILREYAYQIREMQQSQIDIRQNDTMRILTVVTTIFFPLSIITGWYGMNFDYIPELHHPGAYFVLIGVCALIVAGEIWYFKKKGWL